MQRPPGTWWWGAFLALWLAAAPALAPVLPLAAEPARAPAVAVASPPGESAHFVFRYDPRKLTPEALAAARDAAENAYARCASVFPIGGLGRKITIDLTPDFLGATGFANPEEYALAIRVPELEYLGLELPYVMTHEIAHIFTYAELASRGQGRDGGTGPWSEGMADYATGGFDAIPFADWWGPAFRASELWSDPQWLVDGSSRPLDADFVRQRTCAYDQAALFIRYLVAQRGREPFYRFYAGYAGAVARCRATRRREGALARGRLRSEVDSLFRACYGADGETLLSRWQRGMAGAAVPGPTGRLLALHQRIYGSLREFETGYARAMREGTADATLATRVREEFREANRSLQDGNLSAAAEHLGRARDLADPHRGRMTATVAAWGR